MGCGATDLGLLQDVVRTAATTSASPSTATATACSRSTRPGSSRRRPDPRRARARPRRRHRRGDGDDESRLSPAHGRAGHSRADDRRRRPARARGAPPRGRACSAASSPGHVIYLDGHVTGDGLAAALLLCRAPRRASRSSEAAAVMQRFAQAKENVRVAAAWVLAARSPRRSRASRRALGKGPGARAAVGHRAVRSRARGGGDAEEAGSSVVQSPVSSARKLG